MKQTFEPLFRICIDTLLIFLCLFLIHRTIIYQYIDFQISQKITNSINLEIDKLEIDKLLINEYKLITFYRYFRLFLTMMPICDLITNIWTIYIYFTAENESDFGFILFFVLMISFRFDTILWLLLKPQNFLNHNLSDRYCLFPLIWCLNIIPFLSLFINCVINIFLFKVNLLLSMTNEFILFWSPIICPFLILFESFKHFIITYFEIQINYNGDNKTQIINELFNVNSLLSKLNDIFGDKNYEITNEETNLLNRIRIIKYIHFGIIPQCILQTFVFIYHNHWLNQFRLIQYIISILCSIFVIINSFIIIINIISYCG